MRRADTTELFGNKLKDYLGVRHCFLTSSGTSTLYLALCSLKELSNKDEVIIPAYTCPSVLAAVIKAELKPVLCDLDKEKSSFDYHELKSKISNRTLSIISVHLFGIPEDSFKINHTISSLNVFHIEDAAQSFGTSIKNVEDNTRSQVMLGTIGDIGIYSFGRGKPLTLMQGGAITTNSDVIAKILSQKADDLSPSTNTEIVMAIVSSLLYSIFSHPRLFWIPQNLPFLKLGKTIFNIDFKTKQIDAFTSALGLLMIEGIAKATSIRAKKSDLITQKLSRFMNFFITNNSDISSFLRFPLLMKSKTQKESVLSELKSKGLGATEMYPTTLNLFKDTKKYFNGTSQYKNAQSFSERILTLPLHEFLTENDVDKIKSTLLKHAIEN